MRGRTKARRKTTKRPARRKAPTNLSLRIDLVQRARRLGLNLSEVVEIALEHAIEHHEQARWLEENQQAIAGYNAFVKKHGVFGDERRLF